MHAAKTLSYLVMCLFPLFVAERDHNSPKLTDIHVQMDFMLVHALKPSNFV